MLTPQDADNGTAVDENDNNRLLFSQNVRAPAAEKPFYLRFENILGALLTVIWLIASADFLNVSGWWEQRYDMTPPEFMGFLSGMLTPVALIWFVLFYFAGHKRYDDEAARLRLYMNAFLQPSPKDKIYAKTLMENMKNRTTELRDAYNSLEAAGDRIADGFKGSADSFFRLTEKMDAVLNSQLAALDSKIDTLTRASFDSSEKIKGNLAVLADLLTALNDAADKTNASVSGMEEQIRQSVAMMENADGMMTERTASMADEIREQTRLMVHAGERARDLLAEQTAAVTDETSKQTDALMRMTQSVRDVMTEQSELIANDVRGQIRDLTAAQEKIQDNMSAVTLMVGEQADMLTSASDAARVNTDKMTAVLEERAENLRAVFDEQDKLITQKDTCLTETSDKLIDNFQKQNVLMDQETENILSRFKVIETSLESYTQAIETVSAAAAARLQAAADDLNGKKDVLASASSASTSALAALSDEMTQKTEILQSTAETLAQQTHTLSDDMAAHAVRISGVLDQSSQQADMYEKRMSNAASVFVAAVDDCDDKTQSLSGILTRKSSEITDLTNALVSQAMVTQTALEQQQKYLTTSLTHVDEVKKSLKEQADDLFAMAAQLDEKSAHTIEMLMKQMTDTVAQANGVVDRIGEADASLSIETVALNGATQAIFAAYEKMRDELKVHQETFHSAAARLQEKTDALGVAAEKQASVMKTASESMEKRSADAVALMKEHFEELQKEADAVLARVDQTSEKLSEHAAEMNTLFDQQGSSLTVASTKLAEQTGGVVTLLRAQSEQMDTDLERLVSRIRLIQEGLDVQTKEISAASELAVTQLEKAGESIGTQTNALAAAADTAKVRINDASDTFVEKTAQFSQALKETTAQALDTAEQIEMRQAQFRAAADELSAGVKTLSDELSAQTDGLQKQSAQSTKQAILVRDAMQRQIVELGDVANVVATQSRLGEASLAQQTHYLRDAAEEVMTHIRAINEAVRQNTNDLLGASSRIGFELDAMGENLRQRNEEASKAAADSLARSQEAAAFLDEKAGILAQVTQQVVSGIRSAGDSFDGQTKRINAAAAAARDELTATGDTFLVQSHQLNRISEEAQKAIKGLSVVLRERAMDFNKTAENSGERVNALKDIVHQIGSEFEDMSNKGVIQIDLAGQRLRSMIGEVAANSERIAGEVRKSGEQFVGQSDVLTKAADEAMARVRDLLDLMKEDAVKIQESGDKISSQSIKLGGAFNRQVQALISASKTAEEYVAELDKRKEEADTKRFMNDASFIIEKLQSAGVDMTRLFAPNVEDDLWKRYYAGDRSAFLRYLSRALDKSQVRKMSEMFAENKEFREYVSKYLGEFESVLHAAQATDRGEVMTGVLLGSEAGHLYMLLGKVFSN